MRSTSSAAKPGREPGPSRMSTSASPANQNGFQPTWKRPKGPTSGRTGRSNGDPQSQGEKPSVPAPPTPPGTFNPKSPSGTGSATATTRSKSTTWTFAPSDDRIARLVADAE